MELSKRLKTVAAAVTPGHRVADVGTDHGYIPIYLVERGLCPAAWAMDVNRGPLARAEERIRQEGLSDRIGVRLSDGLEKLSPEETDTVVIAGMGGELICRILREGVRFLKAGRELILQPQSEWFKVRRLLHEYSYRIGREWFLKEDGKYYVVIKAEPAPEGETEQYPDAFTYQYGSCLLAKRDPVLLEYLQKEMEKKQQILEHMAAFPQTAEESLEEKRRERCRQLEEEVEEIRQYLQKGSA